MQLLWYFIVGCSVSLASKIVPVAAMLLILWIVADIVYYEIWCKYRRPPQTETLPWPTWQWPGWELGATIIYDEDDTFYPAIWCDSDPVDDPLHPHVSIVYMIGVKKYGSFLRKITIWRVSTVSDHREFVDGFLFVSRFPFYKSSFYAVCAYVTKGVIFIRFRNPWFIGEEMEDDNAMLLIYDVRFKKWCKIAMDRSSLRDLNHDVPIAILCLRRRPKQDTVDGWRIRYVSVGYEWQNEEWIWRTRLSNVTIDVVAVENRPKSVIVASMEDLIIRLVPNRLALRTPGGKFGFSSNHVVYVYDMTTNRFQRFDYHNFLDTEAVLGECKRRLNNFVTPWEALPLLHPMVMNEREMVHYMYVRKNQKAIIRTGIKASTLLMASVQNLFRSMGAEMEGVTVEKFLEEAGVDLSGHLPARRKQWWKIW